MSLQCELCEDDYSFERHRRLKVTMSVVRNIGLRVGDNISF